ncbi:hypothetical protein ABZ419_19610 [Streptomyces cinnamoneus]
MCATPSTELADSHPSCTALPTGTRDTSKMRRLPSPQLAHPW